MPRQGRIGTRRKTYRVAICKREKFATRLGSAGRFWLRREPTALGPAPTCSTNGGRMTPAGAMTRAQWKQGHKNGNKGFCCAETRKFVQQLFSRPCNISRYEILAGDQRFLEPSVSLCQSVSSVSQSSLSVPVFVCACCACCALPPAHWRTNARRKRLCVGLALSGLPDDELSKRFLRRSPMGSFAFISVYKPLVNWPG